jgi:Lipocalin-like domain
MTAEELVGTWRLVDVQAGPGDAPPWGAGLLSYTADGYVFAFLEAASRQPFASPAPELATPAEKASVVDTSLSYSGRYRVVDDVVHHDVVHATIPNWRGTTLSRILGWQGPRLTLTTLPHAGRVYRRRTVLWERA